MQASTTTTESLINESLESRIMRIGIPIIQRAQEYAKVRSAEDAMRDKLFERCLAEPEFKAGLLGFLEVFPTLKTPDLLANHLKEYLGHLDLGMFLGAGATAARFAPSLAAGPISTFAKRTARNFIIEEDMNKAATLVRDKIQSGEYFTFDILGEITQSEAAADRYQQACIDALTTLGNILGNNKVDPYGKPLINFSLKPSALSSHFDPINPSRTSAEVRDRLRPIFEKAGNIGAFVNIDMEHYQYRDLINTIFMDLLSESQFQELEHAGTVIQAYLQDSEQVLNQFLSFADTRKTPFTIRLVKGAYWDHERAIATQNGWKSPVWDEIWQTNRNYEILSQKLLCNHKIVRAAIASHNARSIVHALSTVEQLQIPPSHYEIQVLYGMAKPIARAVREQGHQVRYYGPVGELIEGMGYFVRRLLENSANGSFLRRFNTDATPLELLAAPSPILKNTDLTTASPVSQTSRSYFGWLTRLWPFGNKNGHTNTQKPVLTTAEDDASFQNHPSTEWHKEDARIAMRHAIAVAAKPEDPTYALLIDGKDVHTGHYLNSYNPSIDSIINEQHTSVPLGRVALGGQREIQYALNAAEKRFTAWSTTTPQTRAEYGFKFARKLVEQQHDFAALICFEMGKPPREAYADVAEAIDFCNYYATQMIKLARPKHTERLAGERNVSNYRPRGPMVAINPFNFFAIAVGQTVAPLMAGNTVITKPSLDNPLCLAKFVQLTRECDLPAGVLNYVACEDNVAHHLTESAKIHKVIFTGSVAVGTSIYETLAKRLPNQTHLRSAICEMGGKNAIIIDEDADLDRAVQGALYSAFSYSGQKCSANSRTIVLEAIYDTFLEKIVEATRSLRVGQSHELTTDVGPLINKKSFVKVTSLIDEAIRKEAKPAHVGMRFGNAGYYVGPTILEITPDNPLANQEIFGPVLGVMKARDFNHALDLFNGVSFALTGGLYSRTPSHLTRFEQEAQAGNLYLNRGITGAIVKRQPFGGFRMSGSGPKAGGPNYLPSLMHEIHVTTNTERSGYFGE